MRLPNFRPEGTQIIDNPGQVTELLSHEKRAREIAKIQATLRERGGILPSDKKKELLADLFNLMEEDEVARRGAFEVHEEGLHTPSQKERDMMYAVESKTTSATNDSVGGQDTRLVA